MDRIHDDMTVSRLQRDLQRNKVKNDEHCQVMTFGYDHSWCEKSMSLA